MTPPPTGTDGAAGLPEVPGVTHRFVPLTTGLRMHVAEAGDADAPPVLLLHGFPQHWWEWRRVIGPSPSGTGWSRPTCVVPGGRTRRRTGTPSTRSSPTCWRCSTRSGRRGCGSSPTTSASSWGSGSASTTRIAWRRSCAWVRTRTCVRRRTCWPPSRSCGPSRSSPHRVSDRAHFTARLHAEGHPEAGSALYRHLILPETARFFRAYRGRRLTVPTVALVDGAEAGVRPGMLDVHGVPADDLVGHVVDGAGHFLADDRPDAVVDHALALFGRVSR